MTNTPHLPIRPNHLMVRPVAVDGDEGTAAVAADVAAEAGDGSDG